MEQHAGDFLAEATVTSVVEIGPPRTKKRKKYVVRL